MRRGRGTAVAALAFFLAGCAGVHNLPVNVPISGTAPAVPPGGAAETYNDDLLIGLSFSGGGTRAAAFSYGALAAFDETMLPLREGGGRLIERIDFVSGVSGGSVTAAYFGLKHRAALADFRERFLLRNAEEELNTQVNLATLGLALGGGVNGDRRFSQWLDQNLFGGATFADLRAVHRPRIWINASDIYNRTPFVFGATAFGALCSDLYAYPVSDAVAASAAVPIVFAPVVLESYADRCNTPLPSAVVRARRNPQASPLLRDFAEGIAHYRDGSMKYVKLLDGGLVDNFGLSGFTIARLAAEKDKPYEPMPPQQAVKIRRALFLVVDAGRSPSGDWAMKLEGPSGTEIVAAAADTAIDASVNASYTAFQALTSDWQQQLIRWRCSLSAAERAKFGLKPGWNCRDLKFFVGRVSFEQFSGERAKELNAVPTRFHLPPQTVDLLIEAGREAVRGSATYRAFVGSL
jgi:NTE family protein